MIHKKYFAGLHPILKRTEIIFVIKKKKKHVLTIQYFPIAYLLMHAVITLQIQ